MLLFALDDEPLMLEELELGIREAAPEAELRCFSRASRAIAALRDEGLRPDVVFSDIEMPGMGGLELAKTIKGLSPASNIVFVTGFPEYALEAVQQHVSGFMVKPASADKIRREMANLRYPVGGKPKHRIRIQCFGDFEIFADGIPVPFTRSKSKELLAYLVDRRGAACSAAQAAAVLWEDGIYDRSRQRQFATLRAEMLKALRRVDADYIISRSFDALAVLPQTFECDYYSALAGDAAAGAFTGEYMAAYSWAEFTTAAMSTKLPK